MSEEYKYMVCIRCITYNHEKYLADALEGFVMQKTNFPFVAIVHDDASTDGTAAILREYAEKYPDIIKPIYETENQYSKHDGSIGRIMDAEMAQYNPKYIALCEGDDYWTDPYKLQKQVDFLESHEKYVACLHKTAILNETNRDVVFSGEELPEGEIVPNDVFPKWTAHINSLLMRSGTCEKWPLKHKEWMNAGDNIVILQCMHVGHVWGLPDTMSIYRMNDNSLMAIKRDWLIDWERYTLQVKAILFNFPKVNREYCCLEILDFDIKRFHNNDGSKNRWFYYFDAWRCAPRYMIKRFYSWCKHCVKIMIKPFRCCVKPY